jgi:long-chain acyl-CoA synthetase
MNKFTLDIIPESEADTLPAVFRNRVRRTPDAEAYRYHDGDGWRSLRWSETAHRLRYWRTALAAEGLAPGDRVAVMAANGPDWVLFDQAALSLGLIVVPLYMNDRAENAAHVLEHSGARLLLLESQDQWDRLSGQSDRLQGLERIVSLQTVRDGDPRLRSLEQWLPDQADDSLPDHPVRADDPATIVYTSGTTGLPKGVVLRAPLIIRVRHLRAGGPR